MDKAQEDAGSKRARILVVDDHAVVREALTKLVEAESDLAVCGEAENAAKALEAVEKQQFDLAIVDIAQAGASGVELIEKLRSRSPRMVVIMLSMHDGPLYAQRALKAGAAGYVAKYEAAEKIITAIRQVLAGGIYVSDSRLGRPISGDPSVSGDGREPNNSG